MESSREKIIDELVRLGAYDHSMDSLSDAVLAAMLEEFKKVANRISKKNQGIVSGNSSIPKLSHSDIKILSVIAKSTERLSGPSISKELGIPLTTAQRHLKKLRNAFLETRYSLRYEQFGLRKAILLISVNSKGTAREIGNKVLGEREMISVVRVIGENNISIMSEVLFRENTDLLDIIERIKSFEGVDSVNWIEIVEKIQTNPDSVMKVFRK